MSLYYLNGEKHESCNYSITFPAGYYGKNINIFDKKLTNGLFSL